MRKTILGLALLVLATACGNSDPEAGDPSESPDAASAIQACEDRKLPKPDTLDEVPETKPEIEIPDGAAPCDLVSHDIVKGDGDEAEVGATVTVRYVGVSWSTGEEFDSSWKGPATVTFPLSNVIAGWQEGIPGMKEGGVRQLTIPPDLAYGAEGRPGIAPNETLVFIIHLSKTD